MALMTATLFRCIWLDERDGTECSGEQLPTSKFCSLHAPASEMDLSGFHASRIRAARYKLADSLPKAADLLSSTLQDENEQTGNRLKAAVEVFDRAGIPRAAASTVTLQGELSHRVTVSAADMLQDRLDALARRAYPELDSTVEGSTIDAEDDVALVAPPGPPTAA